MIRKIGITLLIIVLSTMINYLNFKWVNWFVISMMFSIGFYLFYKEIKILFKYSFFFMFNLRDNSFNKKIERPRLFAYLMIGSINFMCFYQYLSLDSSTLLNRYIFSTCFLTLFLISSYFLKFTWDKRFYETFVKITQNKIFELENKSYELIWNSKSRLKTIYENLLNNFFIEILDEKTNNIDTVLFSDILYSGKIPEKPIFKLNMDNIQTKLFFDLLAKESKGFTLDVFLKIFINKNQGATRNSIEVSYSKSKSGPKMKKEITACFYIKSSSSNLNLISKSEYDLLNNEGKRLVLNLTDPVRNENIE